MRSFEDFFNAALDAAVKSGNKDGVILVREGDDGRIVTQVVSEDEFAAIAAGNNDAGFDIYGQRYEHGDAGAPQPKTVQEPADAVRDTVKQIHDILADPAIDFNTAIARSEALVRIVAADTLMDFHQQVITPKMIQILTELNNIQSLFNQLASDNDQLETENTGLKNRLTVLASRYESLLRLHGTTGDTNTDVKLIPAERAFVNTAGAWADAVEDLEPGDLFRDANGGLRRVVANINNSNDIRTIVHDVNAWPIGDRHIYGRRVPSTGLQQVELGTQVPDDLNLVAQSAIRRANRASEGEIG